MSSNYNVNNTGNGRIIGGIILVGAGTLLLLRAMGFYFPGWIFTWPVIVILVGIYSGFTHHFKNNFWILAIATGTFFLLNDIWPDLRLEPYFWPLAIIAYGLIFLFRPRNWRNSFKQGSGLGTCQKAPLDTGSATNSTVNALGASDNSFLRISSIFSGINRTVLSKNFQGAYITSVFGGTEIDLSQADITSAVIIKVEILFAGVKLIVPPHWIVQNEIDGIFHGIDDKRRFNMAQNDPSKVLRLKGSVVFGGIEIRSAS